MKIIRVQVDAFCVAADEIEGTRRGNALQPLLRQMGFEPNGVRAQEVPSNELRFMPARAVRMLDEATKAEYGPPASIEDLSALHQAVLVTNGGMITEVQDELATVRRTFNYIPQRWAHERTRRAQARATRPIQEVPVG